MPSASLDSNDSGKPIEMDDADKMHNSQMKYTAGPKKRVKTKKVKHAMMRGLVSEKALMKAAKPDNG